MGSNSTWTHVPPAETRSLRIGALAALAILSGAYLSVLYQATTVVGSAWRFMLVVVAALAAAVVMAQALSDRQAIRATLIVTALAIGIYLHAAPGGWGLLFSLTEIFGDLYILATGTTILSIVSVDLWALAVAPGPIFLSWHFAIRSRYAPAAGVGIAPTLLLLMTGDLSFELGLAAVLAVVAIVGCGELAQMRAAVAEVDLLAIVIALMLVSSLAVTVVPGSGSFGSGSGSMGADDGSQTTEAAFVDTGGEVAISGDPSLSPEVRYTIEADDPGNWRVDAYDRYTGDGWVQTGEVSPFDGTAIMGDEGRAVMDVQTEVDGLTAMPAHHEPRSVDGIGSIGQTPEAGLVAGTELDEGTAYTVTSTRPDPTAQELRSDEWTDSSDLAERYTQLPADTPNRIESLTTNLTADATSPHEAALIVEQYLIETNNYSLDVPAPDGDAADEQLFERDEGYCVYFATTMAVMLRTQDIPARMVTGYSSGEQVDDDRWVVRGMNAHAWVEVYIPDVGWMEFDPTPAGPYDDVRQDILNDARQDGEENVDTEESEEEWEPDESEAGNESDPSDDRDALAVHCDDPQAVEQGDLSTIEARSLCTDEELEDMHGVSANVTDPDQDNMSGPLTVQSIQELTGEHSDDDDERAIEADDNVLPPTEWMAVGFALLIGGIASIRRSRIPENVRHTIGIRWQGASTDPTATTVRAWGRLETHLGRSYRARRSNESVQAYVARLDDQFRLDPRVMEIADVYERARYREGGVSSADAREAVRTVDELIGVTGRGYDR